MLKGYFRTTFALAGLVTMALASAGQARTIYECTFEDRGPNRNWLPTIVYVAYDPGSEEVQVSDPIIESVSGGPISVKPRTDNDARLSLRWTLMLESTAQNDFQWTYDFTVYKADNKAKITGTPRGYSDTLYAPGTCKVKKG